MSTEKTDAIVLRLVDWSETSVVATIFTRDFGKISAVAKGARRPKSAFETALDLLAVCRVVFLHKNSEALDLLTEARLVRRFRAASDELPRLYAGYYAAELLLELTDTADPHPELYAATDSLLLSLDHQGPTAALILWYEMTALRLVGHMPSLFRCTSCDSTVPAAERYSFGQMSGGLLCANCRPGVRQVFSVSSDAIIAMRQFAEMREAPTAANHAQSMGEIRGIMNHYLRNLTGKRLKMHTYISPERSPAAQPTPPE